MYLMTVIFRVSAIYENILIIFEPFFIVDLVSHQHFLWGHFLL